MKLKPRLSFARSSGVNRPLLPADKKEENVNHTFYRDQINKLANALNEIISSLKSPDGSQTQSVSEKPSKPENGKGQRKPKGKRIVAIMAAAIVLITALYFFINRSPDPHVSQSIRQSRIAVLPYENKTNDPELDVLGDMAADWIIQGLMNLDELKIVSFQTVKDNIQYASVGPAGGAENIFAKRTGAQKIIQGRFYKQGEELIFQSQILDVTSGEIELVLPEIKGKKSNLQGIVSELSELIMTGLSVTRTEPLPGLDTNPLKFEAYKNYEKSQEYFGVDYNKCRELLTKSIAEDSTFAWAYVSMGYTFSNEGSFVKVDSLIRQIELRFTHLPYYEKNYLDQLKEGSRGNLMKVYELRKKVFDKDPMNWLNNLHMGLTSFGLNKPGEAVNYFSYLDPASIEIKTQVTSWWHANYARSLTRLNRLEEALKILSYVPVEMAALTVFSTKASIYVLRHQQDSIHLLLKDMEDHNLPRNYVINVYQVTANKFGLKKDRENQKKWAQLELDYLKSQPSPPVSNLAYAYYYLEDLQKALDLLEIEYKKNDKDLNTLSRIGCLYAKMGKTDEAKARIRQLENFPAPFSNGGENYAISRIYAALGEKQLAVDNLIQAFRKGYSFDFSRYDNDFELQPLFDYPAFQEFVKPKG